MNPDTTLDDVRRLLEQIHRFGAEGLIAQGETAERRQDSEMHR